VSCIGGSGIDAHWLCFFSCCRQRPQTVELAAKEVFSRLCSVCSPLQMRPTTIAPGVGIKLPFGGMKKSGHGREKGFAALHEMSILRSMTYKHG